MWKYETTVAWESGKQGRLHARGNPDIKVATPPEFGGPQNTWSPEDLLAGAVASCMMTTSLFFLEKAGIKPLSYLSNAAAVMEKTASGLAFTEVSVAVSVSVANAEEIDTVYSAIEKAEKSCPVSKSLNCKVTLSIQVDLPSKGSGSI